MVESPRSTAVSTEQPSRPAEHTQYGGTMFHAGEVNDWCKYYAISPQGNPYNLNAPDLTNFANQVNQVIKATVGIDGPEKAPIKQAATFGLAAVKVYLPDCLSDARSVCSGVAVKAPNGEIYIISCSHALSNPPKEPIGKEEENIGKLKHGGRVSISWIWVSRDAATWQGNCPVPDPTANLVDCIIPDDLAIYQLESGQDLAADQHTIQLSDIAILELRDSTTALPYPAWLVGYASKNLYLVGSDAQSKWALEGSDVRQRVQFLLEWNAANTPATIWPPTPFDYFSWRSSSDGLADDDDDTRQRIAEEDDKLPRFTDIYVPNYRAIAVGCFRPHLSRNLLSTEEEDCSSRP
ncbi:hypothetical protein XPA_003875 [Xanthoria parietina]